MRTARTGRSRLASALVLTATLVGGVGGAKAADRVHLLLDWIPTGEHAAYYAGWDKGFWADEGIEITMSRGYGSGDTIAKLAGGAGQFGVADVAAVFTARARTGAPVKAISALYTHSPHSLFVLKSSGITGFRQLEGKRVSITPGNTHKLYFPHIAQRAGVDPEKIVWVNMDASAMAPMLIAGRIDAAPFFSIHHYYQNKAARGAGKEIVVLPFEETGFRIYATSLVTTDDMLENNPDLVRRFLNAAHHSFEWARDNQQGACELHVKRNPEVDLDDCQGSLRAALSFIFNEHSEQTGRGRYDPERLEFTWTSVAEAQDLEGHWDYRQAVDTTHVPGL